jgi:hypothetical protein
VAVGVYDGPPATAPDGAVDVKETDWLSGTRVVVGKVRRTLSMVVSAVMESAWKVGASSPVISSFRVSPGCTSQAVIGISKVTAVSAELGVEAKR